MMGESQLLEFRKKWDEILENFGGDAFDAAEALYVLSHDWGLYAFRYELDQAEFRPSPMLNGRDDLEEAGRELYDALDAECQSIGENLDPYGGIPWPDPLAAALCIVKEYQPEGI